MWFWCSGSFMFLKFHKLFEKDSIKINMKGGELFTTIEQNNNIYNNIWLRGNVEISLCR